MFGEKNIFMEKMVKVSDKRRMFIGSETGAVEGDELVILEHDNYLSVRNVNEVNDEINKLDEMAYNNPELYDNFKYLSLQLSMSIASSSNVDKQGRILLPQSVEKFLSENREVVLKGIGKEVRIYEPLQFKEEKAKVLAKRIYN